MIRHILSALLLAGFAAGVCGQRAQAQDASDVVVRLSQVEDQMRRMSGKIEELQFQNQQLRDQVKRFQQDTEFRFQELGGKGGAQVAAPRVPAEPAAPPRQIAVGEPRPQAPQAPRNKPRDDAFDPQADPDAPGAPRQLGSPTSELPPVRRPGVPASIMQDPDEPSRRPETPLDIAGAGAPPPSTPPAPYKQPPPASTGTPSARADYDTSYSYIQQRQYEQAEMGFRSFLQSHPRSKLVPEATYWLGESYLQRSRYRDAAEQFLKITTAYGTSPRAPDGMFKLGVSLHGLGANDQACATLAEVPRKYPAARPALLKEIQREQQRDKCAS